MKSGINLSLVTSIGAGLLAAVCANASERVSLATVLNPLGYEQIELRRTEGNHLFLFGQLNGRRRSCLVDTGWSFTSIATNVASGLQFCGATPRDAFFESDERSPAMRIESLKLGRVAFVNQPALAPASFTDSSGDTFDVVLGCDFLLRHFAVIGCAARRLYTRRAATSSEDQKIFADALRRAGFQEIALTCKRPLALTCAVRVNGQPLEMLVDTGAVWSCLDARQCERLGVKALPSPARITGAGKTGTRPVSVAEAKSFRLGEVELRNANLALFDLSDWGFAAPGKALSEVQGILGGEILAATGAVIDCHTMKLWLKPPSRR